MGTTRVQWSTNCSGWHVATVPGAHRFSRPVFIALMRDGSSWRWLGFANGRPLGRFNGLALAKREAPKKAREALR